MIKARKSVAVLISIAAITILFLQLDNILAGRIPQFQAFVAIARLFSFIGNGGFLIAVCAALYILGFSSKGLSLKNAGKEGALSLILSGAVVHVLKAAFERPRIGHGADAVVRLLENPSLFDLTGSLNSFPSGHTAAAFAVAYALSRRYPRLSIFFYLTAALIGAGRVYLGSHYPTDVLAGAFVGVCAGYLVAERAREKRLIAGIALLILFISFFKTGGFLLFDVDEAVFSEASREMVETGDYITPAYNYEPRYDKPILIYWLMSASFKLFGLTEFAARFTSSLFGSLLVFMTFLFVRRVKGDKPAYLASLALLLSLEYFVYTHSAVTDMTLAFFISASVYSFYLGAFEDKKWFTAFWVSSALAVLTKGAIGLIFPLVIAFLFVFLSKNPSRIKGLFRPKLLALFLIISVPWFAVQFYINGWEFFNAFIIKHHIQRYSGVVSSHGGPFYFYLGVLLLGFFPWVAFLPGALYRGLKERLNPLSDLYLLSSVWFLFVLVFFSVARTKLPNYIFPLFPAGAILAGLSIDGLIEDRKGKAGVYLMIIISLIFAAALFILPSIEIKMDVPLPALFFYATGSIFLTVAVLSIISLSSPLKSVLAICAVMAGLIIFLRLYALPPVNIFLQKTLYDYSKYAAKNLSRKGVLATYELNKPSVAFYAGRKTIKVEKSAECDIKEYAKRTDLIVITTATKYGDSEELKKLKILNASGGYMLLGTGEMPPFQ
ncbi:MAG: glycosyltransferase family 39 protein [Deltaproteobacteria bacterium]|nr:glycosyltransferase family 39 protein [Deltaproteobacteria bacterium]